MANEFDEIQGILDDIFSEKPTPPPAVPTAPKVNPTQQAHAAAVFEEPDVFLDMERPTIAAPKPVIIESAAPSLAAMEIEVPEGVFADSADRTSRDVKVPIPVFTSDDLMKKFDIRNFATLATLQTNRWHAKVKDRQASKNAAKVTNADERAFETRKKLLVGADELLVKIHKAIDAARIAHYAMTLPWSTTGLDDTGRRTGGRLLMNTLFFEYTQKMAKFRKEMEDALDAFVPEYPNLIKRAQQKLQGSFDPREYPNASSIASHFNLSFDFQPIPKGEDFKGLPQQQLDALAKHLNNTTQTMVENALQENWVRLREVISNMAERLQSPDKKFHFTLVENVREAVRLAKHLNMTNDQRIEDVRKYVEKHLCQHDAQELREKPTLRAQVAGHAVSALQMMDKLAKV